MQTILSKCLLVDFHFAGNQDCAVMDSPQQKHGLWDDRSCLGKNTPLCEIKREKNGTTFDVTKMTKKELEQTKEKCMSLIFNKP